MKEDVIDLLKPRYKVVATIYKITNTVSGLPATKSEYEQYHNQPQK